MNTSPYRSQLLAETANDIVKAHRHHAIALKACPLTYLDELMDQLAQDAGKSVREIATELHRLVPSLGFQDAISVARTKFLGLGLDDPAREAADA